LPSARLTASPTPQSVRLAEAGRPNQAEQQPEDDARQCYHVGQDALVQVDHEEHDHRRAEQQARDQEQRRPEEPRGGGEDDPGRELDERILQRDGRLAAGAAASEP
jgi:hypothetical protein